MHHFARFGEGEGVQARVDGAVAADLDEARLDFPGGVVLQKVVEILFLLRRGQARVVGDDGQEDGVFRVVGDYWCGSPVCRDWFQRSNRAATSRSVAGADSPAPKQQAIEAFNAENP
jgi:hypothetical protein